MKPEEILAMEGSAMEEAFCPALHEADKR